MRLERRGRTFLRSAVGFWLEWAAILAGLYLALAAALVFAVGILWSVLLTSSLIRLKRWEHTRDVVVMVGMPQNWFFPGRLPRALYTTAPDRDARASAQQI
jgi:hypothetical protein